MFKYIVAILALGTGYYFWKKKKTSKKKTDYSNDDTGGPCPNAASIPPPLAPGNGAPIFTGLRVVELCEVAATPICCRMYAELGAEVIKVERPGVGDLARRFIGKDFESDRCFSSSFDQLNPGKRSLELDIKKTAGMVIFKKLLRDADVFITNTRYPALQKLGLTYEELHQEFPHLIYAHFSAYGQTGPDKNSPGFDTSAFWVDSGLSGSIHREGLFSAYMAGFGDVLSGTILFQAINYALKLRYETGVGTQVTNSLFATGLLCQSADLSRPVKDFPEEKQITYSPSGSHKTPLYGGYEVKDRRFIHVGCIKDQAAVTERLGEMLPSCRGKDGAELHRAIQTRMKTMELESAIDFFHELGVSAVAHPLNGLYLFECDQDTWEYKTMYQPSHTKDHDRLLNLSFSCHSSDQHIARCRAPYLGQHTDDILATIDSGAWSERHPECVLKISTSDDALYSHPILDGVTVIELSGDSVAASTAAMYMADYGATVLKVELGEGDHWRTTNPTFFQTMNRGKNSQTISNLNEVHDLLQSADVLITNVKESVLADYGLSPEVVLEQYPGLIYGLITPRGRGNNEENDVDNVIWNGDGRFNATLAPQPEGFPLQMGAIITGSKLQAGISAALFHRTRTGEGQLVETSVFQASAAGAAFIGGFIIRDKMWKDFITYDPDEVNIMRYYHSIPCFQSFKCKDGVWIQLIGADLLNDLWKVIKSMNLKYSFLGAIPKLIYRIISTKGSKFLKLRNIGKTILPIMEAEFAKRTFDEWAAHFKKDGVWFCRCNVPEQMYHHRQVKALELLRTEENVTFVRQPTTISSLHQSYVFQRDQAPELNQKMK